MHLPESCKISALALLSIGILAGCGGGGGSPGINPNTANDPKAVLHGEAGVGEATASQAGGTGERPQQ